MASWPKIIREVTDYKCIIDAIFWDTHFSSQQTLQHKLEFPPNSTELVDGF